VCDPEPEHLLQGAGIEKGRLRHRGRAMGDEAKAKLSTSSRRLSGGGAVCRWTQCRPHVIISGKKFILQLVRAECCVGLLQRDRNGVVLDPMAFLKEVARCARPACRSMHAVRQQPSPVILPTTA